jgi:hypothetical protein
MAENTCAHNRGLGRPPKRSLTPKTPAYTFKPAGFDFMADRVIIREMADASQHAPIQPQPVVIINEPSPRGFSDLDWE